MEKAGDSDTGGASSLEAIAAECREHSRGCSAWNSAGGPRSAQAAALCLEGASRSLVTSVA